MLNNAARYLHTGKGVWREDLALRLGQESLESFQVGQEDLVDDLRGQARMCWHVRAAIGRVGRNSKWKAALRAAFNVEHDAELNQCETTEKRLDINWKRGGLAPSTVNTQLSALAKKLADELSKPDLWQPTDEEFHEELRLHAECVRQIERERLAGGPAPAAWHVESPRDQHAAELWLPRALLHFAVTPTRSLVTIPTDGVLGPPAFVDGDRHYLPTFTDERLFKQFWVDSPTRIVRWRKPGRQVLAELSKHGDLGLAVNQLANGSQDGWYWNAKELRVL